MIWRYLIIILLFTLFLFFIILFYQVYSVFELNKGLEGSMMAYFGRNVLLLICTSFRLTQMIFGKKEMAIFIKSNAKVCYVPKLIAENIKSMILHVTCRIIFLQCNVLVNMQFFYNYTSAQNGTQIIQISDKMICQHDGTSGDGVITLSHCRSDCIGTICQYSMLKFT